MTQSVEQPVKQPVKVKNGRQGEGGGRPMVVLNKEQKEKLVWMAPYLTVAEVASCLVNKAREGDTRAAMFYLRTQGRWREEGHTASERPQIQINVSGINDIKTEKVIEGEVLDEPTAIRPTD